MRKEAGGRRKKKGRKKKNKERDRNRRRKKSEKRRKWKERKKGGNRHLPKSRTMETSEQHVQVADNLIQAPAWKCCFYFFFICDVWISVRTCFFVFFNSCLKIKCAPCAKVSSLCMLAKMVFFCSDKKIFQEAEKISYFEWLMEVKGS